MNSANFIGRLVNTPELRQTQSGISVTSFTLAVKRPGTYGDEEKTDWLDMVAWRGTAEFICTQFEKGMPIAVRCQVQTKQKERYLTFVDDYYNFIGEIPESRYRKELDTVYRRAQRALGKDAVVTDDADMSEKDFRKERKMIEKALKKSEKN